jgi:hypothetical protein
MWVNSAGGMGVVGVRNNNAMYEDVIFAGSSYRTYDSSPLAHAPDDDHVVWAVWSEAAPVPIPGAVWLLGSGLAGIAGLRKKRNKQ